MTLFATDHITRNRRAARARMSAWLRRVVFLIVGLGLMTAMRIHPEMMADVVAWAHTPHDQVGQPVAIVPPSDVRIRVMPRDMVPVRHGMALAPRVPPGGQTTALRGQMPDG